MLFRSARTDLSEKTKLDFYVRLVNAEDDYKYLNETDFENNADPVLALDLTRDDISIPKRDEEGR